MDALLIVSGIVVGLVGWAWLVAHARGLGVVPLLWALLLPWATLLLRGRGFALIPRLLLLTGLLLIVAGGVLLQRQQPERFDLLLSGQWFRSGLSQGTLQGELMGQAFNPDHVVWHNNELLFQEGSGDRVRRSLAIRFNQVPTLLRQPRIERLPTDKDAGPELVLQWYTGALEAPGLQRVAAGYTLRLVFEPQADGRTRIDVHLHLSAPHATRLTGEAWLTSTPAWLQTLRREPVRSSERVSTLPPAPPQAPATTSARLGEWQPISLLAVLDEPNLFVGQTVRLVTQTGRQYEGRLKTVSPEQRIVVAQPQGPNQVDFHFHPLDIRSLEVRYRSTR